MIRGLGIDVVEVARIRRSLERPRFAQRVFSEAERAHLEGRADPAQSAAGMFAAKEAVLKSLGHGIGFLPLASISIEHGESGAPHVDMPVAQGRILVSITHTADVAAAVAVWDV